MGSGWARCRRWLSSRKTTLRWTATRKEGVHRATVQLPIIFHFYPIIISLKFYKRFLLYILQQSRLLSGFDYTIYSVHLTSIWRVATSLCLNSDSWKADVPKWSNVWWSTDSFLCYFTTLFIYTIHLASNAENYHERWGGKGFGRRVIARLKLLSRHKRVSTSHCVPDMRW
jgi:hypothetical protein